MTTPPERLQRRRGATLLVSIAILTLLAVFSIAFVNLVNFERQASANYVDGVRARMIARAGVERAIAEMKQVALVRHYSDPTLDKWLFTYQTPASPGGRPTNLLTTTKPSLAITPDPNIDLFGQDMVVSGVMATGTYGPGSVDAYKLKILDTQSQININHPDPDAACRMLKNLLRRASELHTGFGGTMSPGTAKAHAEAVIDKRPVGGFGSVAEVWQILAARGVPPDAWLNASGSGPMATPPLREMLTTHSYTDASVIRPWDVVREYTFATAGFPAVGTHQAIRDLALQARAPININTASRPVLTALFAELQGKGIYGTYTIPYGSAPSPGATTGLSGAVGLAELIYNRTHDLTATGGPGTGVADSYPAVATRAVPFKTWPEFEQWLDSPGGGVGWNAGTVNAAANASSLTVSSLTASSNFAGYTTANQQGARDLIKAMLNPNSMINKFGMMANHGGSRTNGSIPLVRLMDKSDITHMTTEGCLDSCGVYDITSLGLVLVKNEREPTSPGLMVLSAQTMQTVVRIYDVLRLTTQSDFESHRALFTPGDFITAFDRDWIYDQLDASGVTWCPGVNRPAFGPAGSDGPFATTCTCPAAGSTTPRAAHQHGFEGWPGVTSFPTYSLERTPSGEGWGLGSEYSAAAWDGHLTLSNLQLQQVWPQDFVAGFARGSLKAFKCRVWWEPKDQEPTFIPPATGEWNGNPKKSPDLSKKPTRGHDIAANDADGDGVPYSDVVKLTSPAAGSFPRTVSKGDVALGVLGAPNPLDAVPGKPVVPAGNPKANWFLEGSALTNNGIMVDPRRIGTDDVNPGYISFDGDNIDLFQGTSIRFWVMPTADRSDRDEILFSWVGDQTGTNRHAGFVVKKATGGISGVTDIVLESHCHDGTGSLAGGTGAFYSASIPVTVQSGVAPNPTSPEWIPGQWKWVVLNFGAYRDGASATTYQATLQVDLARVTLDMERDRISGFGEIHGNASGSWLTGTNINFRGVVAGVQQKQLGDWYHCDTTGNTVERSDQQRFFDVLTWNPGNANGNGNGNGNTGRYDRNTNWPANPFPSGAYDKTLTLEFRSRPVPPPPAPLPAPARTGGMTASGPNWNYSFQPDDLGPDKAGGTSDDYQVDLLAQWKIRTPGGGPRCSCCAGSVGCGNHCAQNTMYWGAVLYPPYCARDWKGPTDHGGRVSAPNPSPIHGTCDGCNGCEACDLDAPMFFGGHPSDPPGGQNKNATTVELADASTLATAVFDNIIIKNNKERRSDVSNSRPEDRFYQDTLVQATTGDTGAIYRRGLLEISGVRARLGTLTWTSYSTTPIGGQSMDFAADLYMLNGGLPSSNLPGNTGTGEPTFRFANNTMVDSIPAITTVARQVVSGTTVVGFQFSDLRAIDTTIDPKWSMGTSPAKKPYPRDLLVLQVALRNRLQPGQGTSARASRGIPTPILETPVFEDMTLTLVKETVQILKAEEGVEE